MGIMDAYADMVYRSDGDYLDIISLPYDNYNKMNHIAIMPLGGGWSDMQKDFMKLDGGVNALLSLLPLGAYQGLYSIISEEIIDADAMKNISGGIAGEILNLDVESVKLSKIMKGAGAGLTILSIANVIKETSEILNITPTEYASKSDRVKMIMLENNFMSDLLKALGEEGIPVKEGNSYSGNRQNLVIDNIIYTKEEIFAMTNKIISITNNLRNSEKYKDINIYHRKVN
jgi:hypothetical protein